MSDERSVLLDIADGVARITLNRPDKLNAFTSVMHQQLRAALATVEDAASGARVLVLTGAGRGFCAGQDLGERRRNPGDPPPDLGASIEENYKPLILTLRALRVPVIAAVNGVAAGAGANLALACDIVVAARSAIFVQSFAKLGLVPDAGGTWSLPRLVGNARALGLALLGDRLAAEQAEQWGMIWRCVDDEQLNATVGALAAQLSVGPTQGLVLTRQAILGSHERDLAAALDVERDLQRRCGFSADYAEGVAAFAAKREPRFTGE